MKRLLKTLLLPILALAMAFAFIACEGEQTPAVTYPVTYVIGENAEGTAPTETDKAIGEKFIIKSADGITSTGAKFMGWKDGNDIVYKPGDEYTMPSKAVTFTAFWQPNSENEPTKYTVTYNLNGGSGTLPTETDKAEGEKFNLAASTGLTNGEKEFDGWSDGTKKYDAGAEYTMPNKAVTLTAQWKDKGQEQPVVKYTVTYKHGAAVTESGAAVADIKVQNQAAGNYTVGNPTAYYYEDEEAASYLFSGWVNEKNKTDDNPTVYLPGQTMTLAENTTFEALWVEVDNNVYGTADTSSTVFLYAYPNGIGAFWHVDAQDRNKEVWTFFTYTLTGETIKATPVGGTEVTGTFANGELTMSIKIGLLTYYFEPESEQPTGAPTFTFQLNGGTGTVPTLTVTEDMKKGDYYMVPMPANTIEPPAGKAFRRWIISDGKSEWNTNAGSKFSADAGVAYTVKPEWKDEVVAPVVPTGTEYNGDWNTPAADGALAAAIPSVNIKKIWLDLDKNVLFYQVTNNANAEKETLTASNDALTAAVKTAYGADASLYEVKIKTLGYYLIVTADKTKLAFAKSSDADMKVLNGSEFTKAGGSVVEPVYPVTYTGVIGDVVVLSDTTLKIVEWDNEICNYTRSGNIVNIEDMYFVKVDDEAKTYVILDGMQAITYTAANNTTLTFDGCGVATLGTHTGTYTLSESYDKFTLVIGGNTYSNIVIDTTINITITIDGTDYIFGNVSQPITYTITFEVDNNVQNTQISSTSADGQAQVTFPDDPSKANYYFVGWGVKSSDGTVGSAVNTWKYKVTQDTTFVALWVKTTFTVTYLPGEVGTDAVTGFEEGSTASVNQYTYKGTIARMRSDVTRAGYILSHWVMQGDDSGTTYLPGQANVTITGDTTFVAVWAIATPHTVTYNLGGGTGTLPTETNKVKGEKFNLAAATGLTNGDKEFDGWSDGTKKYEAGAEYTMPDEDVTLTAQWKDASTGGELTGTKTYVGSCNAESAKITSVTINLETNEIIFNNNGTAISSTKSDEGYFITASNSPSGAKLWIVVSGDGNTIELHDDWNGPDELYGTLTLQA